MTLCCVACSGELDNNFVVEGVVTDMEGLPLPGVEITITAVEATENHPAWDFVGHTEFTDAEGNFGVTIEADTAYDLNILGDKDYNCYIRAVTLSFYLTGYKTLDIEFRANDLEDPVFIDQMIVLERELGEEYGESIDTYN